MGFKFKKPKISIGSVTKNPAMVTGLLAATGVGLPVALAAGAAAKYAKDQKDKKASDKAGQEAAQEQAVQQATAQEVANGQQDLAFGQGVYAGLQQQAGQYGQQMTDIGNRAYTDAQNSGNQMINTAQNFGNQLTTDANGNAVLLRNTSQNYADQLQSLGRTPTERMANAQELDAMGGGLNQTLDTQRGLTQKFLQGPQADSFEQRMLERQGSRQMAQNIGAAAGAGALGKRMAARNAGMLQSNMLNAQSDLALQQQQANNQNALAALAQEGNMANNLTGLQADVARQNIAQANLQGQRAIDTTQNAGAMQLSAQQAAAGLTQGAIQNAGTMNLGAQQNAGQLLTQGNQLNLQGTGAAAETVMGATRDQIGAAQQLQTLRSNERMGHATLAGQAAEAAAQRSMQRKTNQQNQMSNMITGAATVAAAAAPTLLAASDKNLKTDIKDATADVKDLLKSIKVEKYKYKDKKFGEGEYLSPMAQDLEKTKIGKDMVIDTDEGKMVDYSRASGTLFSVAKSLDKRLEKLEKKLKK